MVKTQFTSYFTGESPLIRRLIKTKRGKKSLQHLLKESVSKMLLDYFRVTIKKPTMAGLNVLAGALSEPFSSAVWLV